jgi:orotidine-5'-phosphate decarboxylase
MTTATIDRESTVLSQKPIPVRERLIVALDVPSQQAAKDVVTELGDVVTFYKLGLELFMAGGYFELIDWLHERGKKVFVDLKFFDVENTVAAAVRQLRDHHVAFATVHGNEKMLRAASKEKNGVKILAVTVLTSLDEQDIHDMGFQTDVQTLVTSRARRALEAGVDGVISSGMEAPALRAEFGERLLIVCPGIRPVQNIDDQKRTVNVETAFRNGADYIVVGRPILQPDSALHATVREAAEDHQRRIEKVFAEHS